MTSTDLRIADLRARIAVLRGVAPPDSAALALLAELSTAPSLTLPSPVPSPPTISTPDNLPGGDARDVIIAMLRVPKPGVHWRRINVGQVASLSEQSERTVERRGVIESRVVPQGYGRGTWRLARLREEAPS